MSGLDQQRARAFIAAIPDGCWTAYKDVAEAAGSPNAFMAIGVWLRSEGTSIAKYWRVIHSDGSVAPGFVGHAPGLPHDPASARELLALEGVPFSTSGRARQTRRFRVKDWDPSAPPTLGSMVPSPPPPTDGIRLGATVRARDLHTGTERTWTLAGLSDIDPASGRVSVESPVGRALIGRAIGEVVTVSAPAGERRYQILDAHPYAPPAGEALNPEAAVSARSLAESLTKVPPVGLTAELLARAASESPDWLPVRIAHADWGTAAAKCVVATAELADGIYHVHPPQSVLGGHGLIERMRLDPEEGRSTLLGFDFPLGVPRAYARDAGITNFAQWFRDLDLESPFFEVALDIGEVSTARPFFPMLIAEKSPGIKAQFYEALGLSPSEVLRRCDRAHCRRKGASEMFWALGPAAVGKMTLAAWQHAIRPALVEPGRLYAVWPFDGPMQELLEASDAVIVETYPADAYRQLDLRMGLPGTSKTTQADRAAEAPRLREWCVASAVHPDDHLVEQLVDGFGAGRNGEDLFDAVVGLFGMIDTMRRAAEPELPDDPQVRMIEGWMFGQHAVCPG